MTQAEALARRLRRLSLNRQGTEAQVWLEEGFLYLRQDAHARFAQGVLPEGLLHFALFRGGVELRFQDGSRLRLSYRLGRLRKAVYFS
ncbi:hypothetical protein [Thermus sediminis]|uniref:hypothetical protein n=1 Tax=Thermus sediminis TaxID=1761908 RepID=UPI000E3BAB5C|nr:hypothetical protein [Thermus sediminis]